VLEGAGSPVEVNLQPRDLTNLRLAQYLRARCLLVADIERGGVFAQVVGTLALLRPVERPLIRGILINRFRGRAELFDEGRRWLERETGIPVLGVMPWLEELFPPEDSLDLLERRAGKPRAELTLAVLRLPSLSNFSDLDPLEAEPSVRLRWIRPGEALGSPDAVILPGSKQTLRDLAALRTAGLADALERYLAAGGVVFGLCGGLQMLGRDLLDPHRLEGDGGEEEGQGRGLDLLPLRTRFGTSKRCGQRRSVALWPEGEGLAVEGFELHHGRSEWLGDPAAARAARFCAAAELGWWCSTAAGGWVAGTYLHGIFDNGPWRRRWLNELRRRRALPPLAEQVLSHSVQRSQLLDRLAEAFERHVDLTPLLKGDG
jgi:adenosylcobyric acid synthase